jgi:DNA repair exonuclease SbcCD nuclease subunit
MKRLEHKSKRIDHADAILTADWHLREDTPTCRTDDFQEAQWKKIQFIKDLQEEHGCKIYHSGDLFNHWKSSPHLLSLAIKFLPDLQIIYGNHDLPQHNLGLAHKSGLYTLKTAGKITLYPCGDWGTEPNAYASPEKMVNEIHGRKVYLWHTMTYQHRKPWPGMTDPSAIRLLKKYPQFDLIVTGHNHKPFVEEYEGRLLVNPGCITRQATDESHKPRVYLWYASENRVEAVYLPIQEDVITREHIEIREKRDARIDAFVSRLDGDWEAEMSFEDNLEAFFQTNNIRQSVKDIIYKALDDE